MLHEKAPDNFNYIVTLERTKTPRFLGKLFGKTAYEETMRAYGNGTCWKLFPSMEKMGQYWEFFLLQVYEKIKYQESQNEK